MSYKRKNMLLKNTKTNEKKLLKKKIKKLKNVKVRKKNWKCCKKKLNSMQKT